MAQPDERVHLHRLPRLSPDYRTVRLQAGLAGATTGGTGGGDGTGDVSSDGGEGEDSGGGGGGGLAAVTGLQTAVEEMEVVESVVAAMDPAVLAMLGHGGMMAAAALDQAMQLSLQCMTMSETPHQPFSWVVRVSHPERPV